MSHSDDTTPYSNNDNVVNFIEDIENKGKDLIGSQWIILNSC